MLITADGSPGDVPVYRDNLGIKPLTKLPSGTVVTLIQDSETVCQIELPEGTRGFVYKKNTRAK
jgi:hypothetical protein